VEGFEIDLDRPLPAVAIGHATHDPLIAVDFARQARDLLMRAGTDVYYRESPLPHTIDPGFLADLAFWIGRLWDDRRPHPQG
jgi:predicted esterase